MWPILIFFVAHWMLSVFAQTFYLHRYGAHRMFAMNRFWDRFFYLFSFIAQGPSFLNPRAYAVLHCEHHAFSDTGRDPHSPLFFSNVGSMMWATKKKYDGYAYRRVQPEARFDGGAPEWRFVDRLSQNWITRITLGTLYGLFYLHFAPSLIWFALLPVHWIMGPIHGAIVNWGGHKYGYTNWNNGDNSKNSLAFDFLTLGELFQNNHHYSCTRANFAMKWFEIDPCYQVMRLLAAMKIIDFNKRPLGESAEPAAAELAS
jgi:stearoyl-CoA desaturase (delta-9 desaturase)